jgi:membrane protease YdiL (CAAX protease family)
VSGERGIKDYLIGLGLFLALVFIFSAVASPLVFWAIDSFFPDQFPFKRVFNRVLMLSALVALWPLMRFWRVNRWERVGIERWGAFGRAFGIWFGMGVLSLTILTVLRVSLGVNEWDIDLTLWDAVGYLLAGLAVGFLEELLFRGGLCRSFNHLGRGGRAVVVTVGSLFFATAHFLKARPLQEDVGIMTGWQTWMDMFTRFNQGTLILEQWLSLFLIGILLCVLVLRQGYLWGAIGLHAGWVFSMKVSKDLTRLLEEDSIWFGGNLLEGLGTSLMLVFILGGILYARRL